MSAFPYAVLITGLAGVGGTLGAVWLKDRSEQKDRAAQAEREDASAHAERQRLAYADLVTTATEMVRNLRQILGVAKEVTRRHPVYRELAGSAEVLGGQLDRAIAVAQMVGSNEARKGARTVHNATTAAVMAIEQENLDHEAAYAATSELFVAIDAFIDAVRPETTVIPAQAPPRRLALLRRRDPGA